MPAGHWTHPVVIVEYLWPYSHRVGADVGAVVGVEVGADEAETAVGASVGASVGADVGTGLQLTALDDCVPVVCWPAGHAVQNV